jgi:N-acetylglucosaminyl-diphospho-decaprenol L-rhamnosyltransferase
LSERPTTTPRVSVLIVNFNSGDWLERCLRALCGQSVESFEAVVLDNASHDGSVARARAVVDDPRIRYDVSVENLGFAAGNNRAARSARAPLLATLNPDAIPAPDWLECLLGAAAAHPDVAMFGSTQRSAGNPAQLDGIGDAYFVLGLPWRGGFGRATRPLPPRFESFAPCAAAAIYRRDGFEALGGFDERFFCYVEDVDLAFRWRLVGGRALQVSDAVVDHAGGVSAGAAASGFAAYHGMRNLIWTFVKNMPGPLFWPLLPGHVVLVALLLLRAGVRGDLRAVGRGVKHALAALPEIWSERRALQRRRRASVWQIVRALNWAPWRLIDRMPPGIRRVV